MKNFARSILNYFAAFNETRFRFNRKLPYTWTDDPFTLELSVFPDFQKGLLNAVAAGKPFALKVQKGQHVVDVSPDQLKTAVLSVLESELNAEFLQKAEEQIGQRMAEALKDRPPQERITLVALEAMREFNLAFRQQLLAKVTEVQKEKVKQLQLELGFSAVPPSSFNPQREVQRVYDDLQKIAQTRKATAGYLDAVVEYVRKQDFRITIFDLHLVLRQYSQLIGLHTVYVFFHEIAQENQKYPMFCVEVDMLDGQQAVEVRSTRDVLMLNTAAINSFEFDTVLTSPRACRFEEGVTLLSFVERFLQAKFSVSDSFMLTPHFRPLIGEGLPTVRFRVGLQAIKEEDRRLLDYSELITTLDTGAGKKFIDLLSQYVGGNVQSTAKEVDRDYRERYPPKSADRLVPRHLTIPLSLNETQKKILTAVEDQTNRIVVVDGPPGTGKSYTITAIVYLASQLGKSVVVTSHKKQALDVLDQALTEQFKKLHPRSKPSVLRFESGGRGPTSLNNIENSLSSAVVNSARSRAQDVNEPAVTADRERVRANVERDNARFWEVSQTYGSNIQRTLAWVQEHELLFGPDADPMLQPKLPAGVMIDADRLQGIFDRLPSLSIRVSLDGLVTLHGVRDQFAGVLQKCEELQRTRTGLPSGAERLATQIPAEVDAMAATADTLHRCLESNVVAQDVVVGLPDSLPSQGLDAQLAPSFEDLRQASALLEKLGENEGGFLGKLFKRKTIAEVMGSISGKYPRLAQRVAADGTPAVLAATRTCIKTVETLRSKYPALSADYLMASATQPSPVQLRELAATLASLKFEQVNSALAELTGSPAHRLPMGQLKQSMDVLKRLRRCQTLQGEIGVLTQHLNADMADLPAVFNALTQVGAFVGELQSGDVQALSLLFTHYGPVLKTLTVTPSDLTTLARFAANRDRTGHFLQYIRLHSELSAAPSAPPPDPRAVSDFLAKNHKLLERQIDLRLSDLAGRAADVQRIQAAVAAGKRISPDLARVLLGGISCVLSEPGLISQHFPMEADMIDILVIDEASQVSIAESISLMLRAKQTIVFGDELQYGAVGAVNVSERYSEQYFKDILRDYARDRHVAMSEAQQNELARAVSVEPSEDEEETSRSYAVDAGTVEWLKTFSVRTSTLAFAKALRNYSETLNVHFRSFPEIISYSNEFFYKESQIELIPSRIRTKPIGEVLRFIKVETKGMSGRNVNLDEIEAIQKDIEALIAGGYKGTIGVICSFREQSARMEELLQQQMAIYPDLKRNHGFTIWFVGDVQGEERDTVYYSFVQDKKLDNADLRMIYPIIGGTADNIRKLKMQRLNVGFSRAKDVMVFVHSMLLAEYNDSRLGNALRHYDQILNAAHDHYVSDESVFGSPAEKELYRLILQTPFFQKNRDKLKLIAQFEIGKYIREEYHRSIPLYRVDFLLTRSEGGKEKSLIIEYDGVEFHTKNPDVVTKHNFEQEYLEYDTARQLELENYGYSFLRINKFSLLPEKDGDTPWAVLDRMLEAAFK